MRNTNGIGHIDLRDLLFWVLLTSIASIGISAFGEEVEKLEVTGSHIKRIDVEGPSPVVTLDREYLEKSGQVSVADVLREQASNSHGSFKEASGSNAAGVAHVNLRGLGAQRTLVLLDGRRLPADAVTGAADLNLIPLAAVERIEILKDGASAVYGSDALGGVVNIITRKDYNGSEIGAKQFWTKLKGGDKQEFSLIGGASSAKSSVTTVVQYRKNEIVWSRDRDWTKDGLSTYGSPGSYRQVDTVDGKTTYGNWKADPKCPAERIVNRGPNEFCSYNYAKDASTQPELDQLGALTTLSYSITDDLDFVARFGANRKRTYWVYAAAPDRFVVPGAVATKLGADGAPLPGIEAGKDVQVGYRLVELGNRESMVETTSFNGLASLKGVLFDRWDWEIASSENRVRRMDLGVSGYAVKRTLSDIMEEGNFNPFGNEGERGSLDTAKFEPWELSHTIIKQNDAKISGELFDMPGGTAAAAFGVVQTWEEFTDTLDNLSVQGEAFGSAGSSGGGSRATESAFAEIGLPVLPSTEIQLAARHDKYSDFGSSTNPKAAVGFRPIKSLMLKASYGTGFKAPGLNDLYAANSDGYPSFIDEKKCNEQIAAGEEADACAEAQYQVQSGGNPGLKEEKSKSMNLGVLFQLSDDISFGLDYWTIVLDNVVDIDYRDLTAAEAAGIDVGKYGVEIERDGNGYIQKITAPLQNLASREVKGVDLKLDTAFKTGIGKFGLTSDHTHLIAFKEEGFPGAGFVDKLGDKSRPKWRNTTAVSYGIKTSEIVVAGRTIAGQKKEDATKGDLPDYVEYDLTYSYATPWDGRLLAGGKNVTSQVPPRDDSTPNTQIDGDLYDQIGPVYFVGYTQSM